MPPARGVRALAIDAAHHLAVIDLYLLFVTNPIYLNSCQSRSRVAKELISAQAAAPDVSLCNNSIFHPSGRSGAKLAS